MTPKFIIMDSLTSNLYQRYGQARYFDTARGAAIAISKLNSIANAKNWVVVRSDVFEAQFNPMVDTVNCLTGIKCQIRKSDVGTCLDPATERYHSM